jgi:hypothetical protein
MPIFHFHTEDGVRISDTEGTDLADVEAAKDAAVQILAETLRNNSRLFWAHEGFSIIVTDDQALTLFSLNVSATMSAALGGGRQRDSS